AIGRPSHEGVHDLDALVAHNTFEHLFRLNAPGAPHGDGRAIPASIRGRGAEPHPPERPPGRIESRVSLHHPNAHRDTLREEAQAHDWRTRGSLAGIPVQWNSGKPRLARAAV